MGLFFKDNKILLDGGKFRGCCCPDPCTYVSCSSAESHAASTVEWCAATIGCAQGWPHRVYMNFSGDGGLFVPADTYFDCSGRGEIVMDKSTRCCNGDTPSYPSSGFPRNGSRHLDGGSAGEIRTDSETFSVTANYAYLDITCGSNFGAGAANCQCNDTEGCEPKGKYGWALKINATNHRVRIWDHASGCRTNRSPDWTLAKGTSRSFISGSCDPGSSDMKLWDSAKVRLLISFEG